MTSHNTNPPPRPSPPPLPRPSPPPLRRPSPSSPPHASTSELPDPFLAAPQPSTRPTRLQRLIAQPPDISDVSSIPFSALVSRTTSALDAPDSDLHTPSPLRQPETLYSQSSAPLFPTPLLTLRSREKSSLLPSSLTRHLLPHPPFLERYSSPPLPTTAHFSDHLPPCLSTPHHTMLQDQLLCLRLVLIVPHTSQGESATRLRTSSVSMRNLPAAAV